jgi:hypothetical protein
MIRNTLTILSGLFVLVLGACNTLADPPEDTVTPVRESLFILEAVDLYTGGALELELEIFEDDGNFKYRVLQGETSFSGDAEISWEGDLSPQTILWIKLFGFPWTESLGETPDPVTEIQNTGEGLMLQNYGNAMNSYQIFSLDYKYITFRSKLTK